MATGQVVVKILIKYNSNSLKEMMKKIRNQLILCLLRKKDPDNDENDIDFRWSDVKEEEDIALTSFIKNLQKQTDEENFFFK